MLTEERVRGLATRDPRSDYATEDEVAALAADWLALRAQVKALTPPPYERLVRCSDQLVEELRGKPTPPVTLQITERPDGFLEFVATRQYAYEDLVKQNAALRAMVEEAATILDGAKVAAEHRGSYSLWDGETYTVKIPRLSVPFRARLAALGEP